MDTEPQEIRNMFNSVALSVRLDQHTLFEWGGMCVCEREINLSLELV